MAFAGNGTEPVRYTEGLEPDRVDGRRHSMRYNGRAYLKDRGAPQVPQPRGCLLTSKTKGTEHAKDGVHGGPSRRGPDDGGIAQQQSQSRVEDEKAIHLVSRRLRRRTTAGTPKTIASLFVGNGEIVNEEGESVQGREGIERTFAKVFKANPKSQISVSVQSLRFVSPSVAMEDGVSTVTRQSGQPAERSRYTVVHVKRDGALADGQHRDLPDEAALRPRKRVKQLTMADWRVGGRESPPRWSLTSYRWADDHRSIWE